MITPNEVNIFGSASHKINVGWICEMGYGLGLNVKKIHMKALDQPSKPCDSETRRINTSACIANFIVKQIGCNPNIQGSQLSKAPPCTTKSQLLEFEHYMKMFVEFHDNDVYSMTGCLSSCEKYQFSLHGDPVKCRWDGYGEFYLDLFITDRSYEEKEQYIIYDTGSFIADVGGYMGLLLGFSLLSIYQEIEALLKRFFPIALFFGKKIYMKAFDPPSKPCDSETSSINTSAWIADYIEEQIEGAV